MEVIKPSFSQRSTVNLPDHNMEFTSTFNLVQTEVKELEVLGHNTSRPNKRKQKTPQLLSILVAEPQLFTYSNTIIWEDVTLSETNLYKRRWLMLSLFSTVGLLSGFQWIEMSIVEDVLVDYYRVDPRWIEWTTTIWSVTCLIFALPGAWMIETYGLKPVLLTCAFLNALGSVLKAFSTDRDEFAYVFIGQTIASICQAVLFGVPPRLASVWFGENELSTANSIGILGCQIGTSLGFALPPFFIVADVDKNVTKLGLEYLNWALAAAGVITFCAMIIWLEEEPPTPPSLAAVKQKAIPKDDISFLHTLKKLIQKPEFLLLMVVYGIEMGIYCSISTLLNVFVITYYPDGQKLVGGLGLAMSAPGMLGLVVAGVFLDTTKKFKEALIGGAVLSSLSVVGFIVFLNMRSIPLQYISGACFGFSQAAKWTIGFEMATELTYPIAEGTTNGVVSASCQVFAIVLTTVLGNILPTIGVNGCFYPLIGLSCGSVIIACLIPRTYKRQDANNSENSQKEPPYGKAKEGIESPNYSSSMTAHL